MMTENKRNIRQNPGRKSSGAIVDGKRPAIRRNGKTGLSAKAAIDRYMEALRKGVTLSQ